MTDTPLINSSSLPPDSQRTVRRALALLEKHLREPGVAFTTAAGARDWLRLHLAGMEREVFMVFLLDNQNRLLGYETLFTGSISSTEVHPREVVKAALRYNAAAAIAAHNHPSGMAEPSQADLRITARLKAALALVDVRLLDHLIAAGREIVSFAERGLMEGGQE